MTDPTEKDKKIDGTADAREHYRQVRTGPDSSDWCRAGLEEVIGNLDTTGYDPERIVTVEGRVEDTIPATVPEEIADLRIITPIADQQPR